MRIHRRRALLSGVGHRKGSRSVVRGVGILLIAVPPLVPALESSAPGPTKTGDSDATQTVVGVSDPPATACLVRLEPIPAGRPTALTTGPRCLPEAMRQVPGDVQSVVAGEVISGIRTTGTIIVRHPNVTVRDNAASNVFIEAAGTGAVIEHNDLGAEAPSRISEAVNGIVKDYIVRRNNIHFTLDGLKIGTGSVVEGNYIHDLSQLPGAHNDGIQIMDGSGWSVRGNNIDLGVGTGINSAIFVSSDFGPISNGIIEGNWLNGGGYTVYSSKGRFGASTNVLVKDNDFGPDHAYAAITGPGLTLQDNRFREK